MGCLHVKDGYCSDCRARLLGTSDLTSADEPRVLKYLQTTNRLAIDLEFARKVLADLEGYDTSCFDELTFRAFLALRKALAPDRQRTGHDDV